MTVEQYTNMHREFKEAGVTFKVYKNTMMHRAFEGTNYAKNIEPLEVKAGVVEGTLYDTKALEELIESIKELTVVGICIFGEEKKFN